MSQDNIRKKVKIAKACNEDIYYKDFADYLDITVQSFYNWLNGYYNLSYRKIQQLEDVITDLID